MIMHFMIKRELFAVGFILVFLPIIQQEEL